MYKRTIFRWTGSSCKPLRAWACALETVSLRTGGWSRPWSWAQRPLRSPACPRGARSWCLATGQAISQSGSVVTNWKIKNFIWWWKKEFEILFCDNTESEPCIERSACPPASSWSVRSAGLWWLWRLTPTTLSAATTTAGRLTAWPNSRPTT